MHKLHMQSKTMQKKVVVGSGEGKDNWGAATEKKGNKKVGALLVLYAKMRAFLSP